MKAKIFQFKCIYTHTTALAETHLMRKVLHLQFTSVITVLRHRVKFLTSHFFDSKN